MSSECILSTGRLTNPLLGGARGGLVGGATDQPTPPYGHPSWEGIYAFWLFDELLGRRCDRTFHYVLEVLRPRVG